MDVVTITNHAVDVFLIPSRGGQVDEKSLDCRGCYARMFDIALDILQNFRYD